MPSLYHDAVVVGSGFGGAVLACRLAEAGRSVLVLERGREWAVDDYPSVSGTNWIWSAERPESENGWLDLRAFRNVAVVQGAGVGGGSLAYANVSIETEASAFAGGWPAGVDLDALREGYARAGDILEVRTLPDGQLTERFRLVRDAATACGYGGRFRKLELAVRFDDEWSYGQPDAHDVGRSVRSTNAHGVEQGTCVHCGNCCIGCPVQAKNTLDLNYLARARREGAEIRPLHLVSHVCALDRGYRVHFDRLEDGAAAPGRVVADEVYLAAGSLGTTEILLRSRDVFKTLGRLSAQLGKGWSANGDFLTLAFYRDRSISATRGPTVSAALSFLDGSIDSQRFFVEDGGFPDLIGRAIQEVVERNPRLSSIFPALGKSPGKTALQHLIMPWLGQAMDASDGTLRITRGNAPKGRWKLDLDWNPESSRRSNGCPDRSAPQAQQSDRRHARRAAQLVLREILDFAAPLGGARMADSAADGVVNQWGEVFGHPGLYVVDGAAIPRPIGLNPSRTIAALAERIAARRLALT